MDQTKRMPQAILIQTKYLFEQNTTNLTPQTINLLVFVNKISPHIIIESPCSPVKKILKNKNSPVHIPIMILLLLSHLIN